MITIREYARPATLEEAWQLNQKRPNRVLGGMLWLKMEKISVGTAIDLSALGLKVCGCLKKLRSSQKMSGLRWHFFQWERKNWSRQRNL